MRTTFLFMAAGVSDGGCADATDIGQASFAFSTYLDCCVCEKGWQVVAIHQLWVLGLNDPESTHKVDVGSTKRK